MPNSADGALEHNRVNDNAFYNIYNCSGISLFEGRDLDNASGFHNVIRGNTCFGNANKGPTPLYGGELTDGNGIIIDWHRGAASILIENNLCVGNGGCGIHIFQSSHVVVRNNTVVGNGTTKADPGVRAAASDDVQFVNNIVVGRDGQTFTKDWMSGPKVSYANNLFFNYKSVDDPIVKAAASNRIGIDPRFVAASTNAAAADYNLRPDSPAIDAGDRRNFAPNDMHGHFRPQGAGPDLGAFER